MKLIITTLIIFLSAALLNYAQEFPLKNKSNSDDAVNLYSTKFLNPSEQKLLNNFQPLDIETEEEFTSKIITTPNMTSYVQTSWGWQNPFPQGNHLFDIEVIDDDTAIAVGGSGTIIKSTNSGTSWEVKYYVGGTRSELFGTHFINSTTGWVVGGGWNGKLTEGIILKTTNTGNKWIKLKSGINRHLYSVYFISTTTGFAVGAYGVIVKTTNGGTTWSSISSGVTKSLYSVYFKDATLGWAVGGDYNGDNYVILKTTNGGSSWSNITSSAPNNKCLTSLFYNNSIVWAIGNSGKIVKSTNDGDTWSVVEIPSGLTSNLESIFFRTSEVGWICGNGAILKTTNGGSTWINLGFNRYIKYHLRNIEFGSTSSNLGWVVGDGGIILKTTNSGTLWLQNSLGTSNPLNSVFFRSASVGWVVGDSGIAFSSTNGGANWTVLNTGVYNDLFSIHFISSSIGIAVGSDGLIIGTTNGGISWSSITSGTSNHLYSVHFGTTTTGWAVGNNRDILKTTNSGASWTIQNSDVSGALYSVFFYDINTGWAVGKNGRLMKTTNSGISWTSSTISATIDFYGVHFPTSSIGFAVGTLGKIYKTTDGGSTWSSVLSLTSSLTLKSVYFVSSSLGWAVGASGIILNTTNGGTSWKQQLSTTSNQLNNINFVTVGSSYAGFIVGEYGNSLVTALSPIIAKTWTGSIDTLWHTAGNWSPEVAPVPTDSIVIPNTTNKPVLYQISPQVTVAGLTIASGAKLTITSNLSRFTVLGDLKINGTLYIRPPAKPSIQVGRRWIINPGGSVAGPEADEGFSGGYSTVYLSGEAEANGTFYNLVIDSTAEITSGGNITIDNEMVNLDTLTLSASHILTVNNTDASSLSGTTGVINDGTVKRYIQNSNTENYQFESPDTYINFTGATTYPTYVSIRNYTNTNPISLSGTWTAYTGVSTWRSTDSNYVITSGVPGITNWALGYSTNPYGEGQPKVRRVLSGGSDELGKKLANSMEVGFRYSEAELESGTDESQLVLLYANSIIAVELQNFIYSIKGEKVQLDWTTATEVDNYGFEVERTPLINDKSKEWKKIGFVQGNGNSNSVKEYSFTDGNPVGGSKFAYRLKQIDNNGKFEYLKEIEVELIPNEFLLYQNYPNPFNPVTNIEFKIPYESKVTLKIFDVLGREVKTLIDEKKEAGKYKIEVDAKEFASGIYIYKLIANSSKEKFESIKKLVVLK